MKRAVFPQRWLPYLLLLPQVAVIALFFVWPALESLRLSLYRASPFGDRLIFVGLANFRRLLESPEYLRSVAATLVFTASVTAGGVLVALVVAALANEKVRGRAAYRALLLWPYAIAPAVSGLIWLFIFHPSYGVLPYWLSFVTDYEFNWLLKGWVAMVLVIVAAAWTHLGYNIAFFLVGLEAIPQAVLEAATIDGAGPLRRFLTITVPLLSPVTFALVFLNVVFAFFETFGVIHAVTQGGPGGATQIMVYKAYHDGFIGLNLGASAAQSVVLMVLVFLLTALQFRLAERKVHY
jgi:sn-glycerol 3-phosphate transport system permease protein